MRKTVMYIWCVAMLCVVTGCPATQGTNTGNGVTRLLGPGGGKIGLDGATLTVPPGALDEFVVITLIRTTEDAPPGYPAYSPIYRFLPLGLNFLLPVTVTLDFDGDPAKAALFWTTPAADGYERVASTVDGHRITGDVEHFSQGFAADGDAAPDYLEFGTAPNANQFATEVWPPFTVEIRNPLGDVVTDATNCVTVSLTTGTGAFSGTTTSCAVNGVATFDTLSFDTEGGIKISFASPGLTGIDNVAVNVFQGPDVVSAIYSWDQWPKFILSLGRASLELPQCLLSGGSTMNVSLASTDQLPPHGFAAISPIYTLSPDGYIPPFSGQWCDFGPIPPLLMTVPLFGDSTIPKAYQLSVDGTGFEPIGGIIAGDLLIVPILRFAPFFIADISKSPHHLALGTLPAVTVQTGSVWPDFTVEIRSPADSLVATADTCVTLDQISGNAISGTTTQCAVNGVVTFTGLSHNTAEPVGFSLETTGLIGIEALQVNLYGTIGDLSQAPTLSLDCLVDDVPYIQLPDNAVILLDNCPSDEGSWNPNSPVHLRLGTFGDAIERDAANALPPENAGTLSGLAIYTPNFQTRLSHEQGALSTFGINYMPPFRMRLVRSDQMTMEGRSLAWDGTLPIIDVNGVTASASARVNQGHGSADYPNGFFDTLGSGGNGTAAVTVSLTGGATGLPTDNPADELDNALRPGDFVFLGSSGPTQDPVEGVYRIVSISMPATLTLDRALPADATGMSIRSEYRWLATGIPVLNEGLNTVTILATDLAGHKSETAFPVIRDLFPPEIYIYNLSKYPVPGYLVDGDTKLTNHPVVVINDLNLFQGGVTDDPSFGNCFNTSLATTNSACVTSPYSTEINISRQDSYGTDSSGSPVSFAYEIFPNKFSAAGQTDTPDTVAITSWPPQTASYNQLLKPVAPYSFTETALVYDLGEAVATREADNPLLVRPPLLSGDGSCDWVLDADNQACAPTKRIDYRIAAFASDLVGNMSTLQVQFSVVEVLPKVLEIYSESSSSAAQAGHWFTIYAAVANGLSADGGMPSDMADQVPVTLELVNGSGSLTGIPDGLTTFPYQGRINYSLNYDTAETIQVRLTAPGLPPSDPFQIVITP